MEDLNDKVTDGTLTADEWNQIPSEIQNVIEAWNQTLISGDVNQLGKGIAAYAAAGQFYTGSGTANAHIATKLSGIQAPPEYSTGMVVRFRPSNANTAAATINVDSLGIKSIKKEDGSALGPGDLDTNRDAWIRYDGTNFLLSNWAAKSDNPTEFIGFWERTSGSTYTLKPGIGGQIIINVDGARLIRTTNLVFDFGDLDTGIEVASTAYYFYINNIAGVMTPVVSITPPNDIGGVGKVGYHPTRTDERCVLGVWNDAGSDFVDAIHYGDGTVVFIEWDADHLVALTETASVTWTNQTVNIPKTALSVLISASARTTATNGLYGFGKDGASGTIAVGVDDLDVTDYKHALLFSNNAGSNDGNTICIQGEIPIIDRAIPAISYFLTRTVTAPYQMVVRGYRDIFAPKY